MENPLADYGKATLQEAKMKKILLSCFALLVLTGAVVAADYRPQLPSWARLAALMKQAQSVSAITVDCDNTSRGRANCWYATMKTPKGDVLVLCHQVNDEDAACVGNFHVRLRPPDSAAR